ncbi:glutamate racemase [Helicobacter heilmannii]|uniref:Glutamate racemase n=1 Tax=Helicobacter heilmannii TaxID=35817 RepID=A0A0K2Y7X9_HELHE|nr:glutamate racemase [Helicobacter heilmannii]BDQ27660.1 glutamate racemase [Helicobacter heilmannii]CCM11649.1 Glutamate racemase [Helicobacter heilmannii ASB1.4]CRI33789.1 Glutamate racemase [Helicobacter heilmannii]
MKIGVFDSGVGGLSVLESLLKARLFEHIIYYGDTARVPYGPKDPATIAKFSLEALDFFLPFNIDMLVVACNSVSAWALPAMRAKTKIPIVGVIEAGVLAITQSTPKNAPILVLGTKATVSSGRYAKELQEHGYDFVESLATGLFVPLIEEGVLEGALLEACMQHYFTPLTSAPAVVVLGCTHFPWISTPLQTYFKTRFNTPVRLVHSGEAIVARLEQVYGLRPHTDTKLELFASGDKGLLEQLAKPLKAL